MNKYDILDLEKKINGRYYHRPRPNIFHTWFGKRTTFNGKETPSFEYDPHIERINQAVKVRNEEERHGLANSLFHLWAKDSGSEEYRGFQQNIFGQVYDTLGKIPLVGSLTNNGKQFRVWTLDLKNVERRVSREGIHIDSCGDHLLHETYGDPRIVSKYLDSWMNIEDVNYVINGAYGIKLFESTRRFYHK
jgi:hypothetical protein